MTFGWINTFGMSIIMIMLIPNLIYAYKFRHTGALRGHAALKIAEQTGRYASILLMIIPIGIWKFAFPSVTETLIYLFGNPILLLSYIVIWSVYFKRPAFKYALVLAIIPVCIFLLSGLCLRHWLLVLAAAIFAVGHISITYLNNR